MNVAENLLRYDERIALTLRQLYAQAGYRPFKMSKFEPYDLYVKHQEFLDTQGIITFNDTNGDLLALKPDVTLSIVNNSKDIPGSVQKVYYDEKVYRVSGSSKSYREIMQTGLECIGDISETDIAQVVGLAQQSAQVISSDYRMVLSHIELVLGFFADYGIDPEYDKGIVAAFFEKNADALKSSCTPRQQEALGQLMRAYTDARQAKEALLRFCLSEQTRSALYELVTLWDRVFTGDAVKAGIDFTVSGSIQYYSGIVFKCYISGIATAVISGGQYDGLMRRMRRSAHAIGFAVYLDALDHLNGQEPEGPKAYINVALPKGRLGEKAYEMFEKAGFDCPAIREQNRKLIFENPEKGVRFFWVKPSDVAIYVERGAADIGIVGYDILLEHQPDVYELCDLNIGKCRMAVACKKDFADDEQKTLRVATKFTNIAKRYYAGKCRDIDIIELNGSIELAPILGLSDVIVDIVETGKTLLENNLEPREDIVQISARLIANKAAYRFKKEPLEQIQTNIARQVQ